MSDQPNTNWFPGGKHIEVLGLHSVDRCSTHSAFIVTDNGEIPCVVLAFTNSVNGTTHTIGFLAGNQRDFQRLAKLVQSACDGMTVLLQERGIE
jgi:hypothetical protein